MKKTVVAITRLAGKYQAVVMSRKGDTLELRSHRHSTSAGWNTIYADITESVGSASATHSELIVGYDSSRVAFYRLRVPEVKAEELNNMVALQQEALLPLPPEQMEIAWRADAALNGKIGITIAAVRKNQLEQFSRELKQSRPRKILLTQEAIVKAWRLLCDGSRDNTVVVYLDESNSHICLTLGGRLALAVTSDVGRKDLTTEANLREPNAERLAQDIRRTLERFGNGTPEDWRISIITGGKDIDRQVAGYLNESGLNAEVALLNVEKIKSDSPLSAEAIYEFLTPIGLALMGLDDDSDKLNLFKRIHTAEIAEKKQSRVPSLKISVPLALGMLFFLPWALMKIDAARLGKIESYINQQENTVDIDMLKKENAIKKTIASQRPDILELMSLISSCIPEGEVLDGIGFKKNQPVTITGHTKDKDKILELQENLQKQKHIKTVRVLNRKIDKKAKTTNYTITFNYKHFGKKTRRLW
ncbi:MAG: PilN domain-containing protein [Sedimentisphaerales bacterium]|nr:PilN domain-containing protein [Sedimentisphaerales bacterium]